VLEHQGRPNQPVVHIATLLQRRYKVAVLSNASVRLESRLANGWGDMERFDAVITSGRTGTTKDDVAIFGKAAAALSLAPESCFHVDDDRWNVETAKRAGFRAIHYDGNDRALEAGLRGAGLEW
jgi:HAD superfamily hydrolase (TIGR01509 family)